MGWSSRSSPHRGPWPPRCDRATRHSRESGQRGSRNVEARDIALAVEAAALRDGDSRLRLVIESCYPEEMASRLLRLQDCFEVAEPPELAAIIRRTADAISRGHGGRW